MKPCPECNGTGKVAPGFGEPDQKWTCSDCDGTGEVEEDDYHEEHEDSEDE